MNLEVRLEMVKEFYGRCRGIFTMSEWLAKDFVENFGIPESKVHPVGGGSNVNTSKVGAGSDKNGKRFLFVGKAWERKNGPLVAAAFQKLMKYDEKCELYIIGPEGKAPAEIKDDKNIFWLGRMSYAEIAEYYNKCDFFVMPSRFEAYGLVFVEALIFGLPCIGNNCFAMPEIIEDGKNGYLLHKENADELCQRMMDMIKNGEKLKEFVSVNQGRYLKKYSWDSVTDRMLDVMRKDGYEFAQAMP